MARKNLRPLCIVAVGLLNIAVYLSILYSELPKSASRGERTLNGPLSVSVPQSITQSAIEIDISRDFCPNPIVRVRLVGPEIYAFPPLKVDSDSPSSKVYTLEVDVQKLNLIVGVYKVEVTLLRCHNKESGRTETSNATASCTVEAEWNNIINVKSQNFTDNQGWVWVAHDKRYIFAERDRVTNIPLLDNLVALKDGETTLSKPKSLLSGANEPSNVLKYFSELSNYELVCWLGDDDAQLHYRAFMDLYPLMGSSGQRPFKFKYIRLSDVSNPTQHFSETTFQTFDKCKILFTSYSTERVDAGISPQEYGEEVATLLNHIEQSHPDPTYPSWFLSLRSSTPVSDTTSQCFENNGLHRTPDRVHEFNEEIRRIIRDHKLGKPPSEVHIHFMDNTDISESLWHSTAADSGKLATQITSAVAMRCMEAIAKTVKSWRSINQMGTQRGLVRNGTLIPNEELFKNPYTWGK